MESVSNILWPIEILCYVSGNARAGNIDALGEKEYVQTKQSELKSCRAIQSVTNYWTLLELVSQIAALNSGYELFYRGQANEHRNPNGIDHQLCPSLWRTSNPQDFVQKCDALKESEARLNALYAKYPQRDPRVEKKLKQSPISRWALIQHYGIADTPMLDLTRSLQIACSFALMNQKTGYVYILGFPFQREMLMTDSYSGIVNVALLGVTPYNAKRPLAQDGYLATSDDWWRLYADSSQRYKGFREVDFSSRIVALFRIEDDGSFWRNSSANKVTKSQLYPKDDQFLEFLKHNEFRPYAP